MKGRGLRLWIGIFSLSTVVLLAVVDMRRTSPGALSTVHGREEELSGKRDCRECHGSWVTSMAEACLDCHTAIAAQIDGTDEAPPEGLHGMLGKEKAQRCALCHSEHHGNGFALVNAQSFAQAGVESVDSFDHRLIGFTMDGAHLALDCAECHEHANDPVLGKGMQRYLGLDQDCASCHDDPHEGRMVVACADCHGQDAWDELASLNHARHLPLVGGHAGVSCSACHEEKGTHALELLGTAKRRPRTRECLECHASPHDGAFVEGVAKLVGKTSGASCVDCHEPEHESFDDERLEITPEQHACSGFGLDAPHDQASCRDCHAPEGESFAARYPGRGPDQCSLCHADPHGGQFATGPFVGKDCIACHRRDRFEPHAFGVNKHALAALKLTGRHLEIECDECHRVPREGEPRVFRGTPSTCEGCHPDAHAGFFARFALGLPGLAAVEHGECARCHGTTTFADVPAERFDHGRWTGFPILGAHAEGACEDCHPLAEEPDETGRRFGRVSEHFGRFEGCSTCHADPHKGAFDGPRHPAKVGEGEGCARCHVETSFRALPYGFDHALWTRFTVVGAHEEAGCSACHEPLARADELGRTWGRAAGPLCSDCHLDPHAGQFAPGTGGRTDCARCHTSKVRSYLSFDHERDSRFALGDAHEDLACSACHLPVIQDGIEVVRYRPLGIECTDCHGVQGDFLLRRKKRAQ